MKSEEALITSTMVALLGYLHKQHAVGSTQTCHSLYKHTVRQSYIEVDESLFCFRLSVQAFSTNNRSKEKGIPQIQLRNMKKRYAHYHPCNNFIHNTIFSSYRCISIVMHFKCHANMLSLWRRPT